MLFSSPVFALQSACVVQSEQVSGTTNGLLTVIPGLEMPAPDFTPSFLTVSGDLAIFSLKRGKRSLGVNVVTVAYDAEGDPTDIGHSFIDFPLVRFNDIPQFALSISRGIITPKANAYAVLWDLNAAGEVGIVHIRNAQFCLYGD